MKKCLMVSALLMTLLAIFLLVACGNSSDTSAAMGSTSAPNVTGAPVSTSGTTESTTVPVTTEPVSASGVPLAKLTEVTELIKEKNFREEALSMMKLVIRDFYDTRTNRVLNGEGGQTTLWAVGSFLEAVAAVYELYPEDEEIGSVYKGLLDRGLFQYRVVYRDNGYSGAKVNGVTPLYYNASAGNSGDYYYDDDLWIAIQYLKAYENLGNAQYLTRAQEILEFVWLGWGLNSDESLGNGGIPWKVGTGPLTCSNAPAAYAFVRFSMLTDDEALSQAYLERSETVYTWVKKYLRSGSLYIDGPGNNWSGAYNNGLMLAAGSLLYQVTEKNVYMLDVRGTARAAFANNYEMKDGRYKFKNDIDNPWMSAWLVKAYVEFYKIDDSNTTSFLNAGADVMAFALDHRLENGYFGEKLNNADNTTHSTDTVNLGGGISLLAVLADWAETYGSNYQ